MNLEIMIINKKLKTIKKKLKKLIWNLLNRKINRIKPKKLNKGIMMKTIKIINLHK